MAMLPILLDMVDDIYDNLEKPDTSSNIPFLYLPQTRGNCHQRPSERCHMRHGCNYRNCEEIVKCPKHNRKSLDSYQVSLDVSSFNPKELSVKVIGNEIIVVGQHEARPDEHGFISRQFTNRYVIPENYDVQTVSTTLDTAGKMTIKAEKLKPAVEAAQERIIPIQRVASVVEQPPAQVENGEVEKKKEGEVTLEDVVE